MSSPGTRPPGGRPPSLNPAETELDAIACLDRHGILYWVRVFQSSLVRRTHVGWRTGLDGRRFETPSGGGVHRIDAGSYLIYSEGRREWIDVEAIAGVDSAPT